MSFMDSDQFANWFVYRLGPARPIDEFVKSFSDVSSSLKSNNKQSVISLATLRMNQLSVFVWTQTAIRAIIEMRLKGIAVCWRERVVNVLRWPLNDAKNNKIAHLNVRRGAPNCVAAFDLWRGCYAAGGRLAFQGGSDRRETIRLNWILNRPYWTHLKPRSHTKSITRSNLSRWRRSEFLSLNALSNSKPSVADANNGKFPSDRALLFAAGDLFLVNDRWDGNEWNPKYPRPSSSSCFISSAPRWRKSICFGLSTTWRECVYDSAWWNPFRWDLWPTSGGFHRIDRFINKLCFRIASALCCFLRWIQRSSTTTAVIAKSPSRGPASANKQLQPRFS